MLVINGFPKWMFPGQVFTGVFYSGNNVNEAEDSVSGVFGGVTVMAEVAFSTTVPPRDGTEDLPALTLTFSPAVARVAMSTRAPAGTDTSTGFACHVVDESCSGASFSGPIPAGTIDVNAGVPPVPDFWNELLEVPANERRIAYSATPMARDITQIVITPLTNAAALVFANAADLPSPAYDYANTDVPHYYIAFQAELYRADY